MSSDLPPTYYFNGIDFNNSFYESSSSALDIATANTLYLQKNINDTAIGNESFTTGIKTDTIQPTINTNALNLYSSSTGVLNIGNSASRNSAININNTAGSTGATNIGNSTNSTLIGNAFNFANNRITPTVAHPYYDGAPSGVTDLLNNVGAGNCDFLGIQTSGYLNIANASNRTTGGTINIGSGVGGTTHTLNLSTGTTANAPINIGSTGSSTQVLTINRPLTVGYTSVPTGSSMIGYNNTTTGTSKSVSSSSTVGTDLHSFSNLPIGVYYLNYQANMTVNTASVTMSETWVGFSFLSTSTLNGVPCCYQDLHINSMVYNAGDVAVWSGGGILSNTSVGTIYLILRPQFTGVGTVSAVGTISITKIA